MAKYTLALCAAAEIINQNENGDRGVITGGAWTLNTGDLDILGGAYSLYQKINGLNPQTTGRKHPLGRNRAVRSSIANTEDGKEMFHLHAYLNFPGISNAWGRVFYLNDEWHDIESIEKRVQDGKADEREERLLECVKFLREKK